MKNKVIKIIAISMALVSIVGVCVTGNIGVQAQDIKDLNVETMKNQEGDSTCWDNDEIMVKLNEIADNIKLNSKDEVEFFTAEDIKNQLSKNDDVTDNDILNNTLKRSSKEAIIEYCYEELCYMEEWVNDLSKIINDFNSIENFETDDSTKLFVSNNGSTKILKTYNTDYGKTTCELIDEPENMSVTRGWKKVESFKEEVSKQNGPRRFTSIFRKEHKKDTLEIRLRMSYNISSDEGLVLNDVYDDGSFYDHIGCDISCDTAKADGSTVANEVGESINAVGIYTVKGFNVTIGGIELGSLAKYKMKIESKVKIKKWSPSFKFMDLTQSWVAYKSEKIEWF
ncbi:MAG: hypothetical protein E7262_04580 [Lachnospiraceae bacterium]|nr:hypothetical protein [Lachnospiraceae bacterium]